MTSPLLDASALVPPAFVVAQTTTSLVVNGVIFAALAGAALFAICRSSSRN